MSKNNKKLFFVFALGFGLIQSVCASEQAENTVASDETTTSQEVSSAVDYAKQGALVGLMSGLSGGIVYAGLTLKDALIESFKKIGPMPVDNRFDFIARRFIEHNNSCAKNIDQGLIATLMGTSVVRAEELVEEVKIFTKMSELANEYKTRCEWIREVFFQRITTLAKERAISRAQTIALTAICVYVVNKMLKKHEVKNKYLAKLKWAAIAAGAGYATYTYCK